MEGKSSVPLRSVATFVAKGQPVSQQQVTQGPGAAVVPGASPLLCPAGSAFRPQHNMSQGRLLEAEPACKKETEQGPSQRTSDYYRVDDSLPARFNHPGWFRGYR